MRKLKNVEIANFVFEELKKKGYDVKYSKILEKVDINIENTNDYKLDENGEISRKLSEKEIEKLKSDMLSGFEEDLEYED